MISRTGNLNVYGFLIIEKNLEVNWNLNKQNFAIP